jgi:ribonuclease BN (tRNA processing enzyme)
METATTALEKKIDGNFYSFANGVYRVSDKQACLCAYLVETSAGLIQVNTVPEFYKTYYPHLKKLPVAVCLNAPVVNQTGDSYTGFEFELWQSRFLDFMNPNKVKFIGSEANLKIIYHRLELTMNGDFVADEAGSPRSKFVTRRWVDDVFEMCPTSEPYKLGDVTIEMNGDEAVKIYDGGRVVFDTAIYPATIGNAAKVVDSLLHTIQPIAFNPDKLGLIVGGASIGTVPGITSNFIFYYGNRLFWIDPPARVFEKAVLLKVNPDHVTDFIITHCHEDHIEGFSGLLKRKIHQRKKLRLLSTPAIYDQLKIIFNPLFKDITSHIDFVNLEDRALFKNYFGGKIEIRENYHPVPTIGLKITFNKRTLGISGDILYSKEIINARLKAGVIDKARYDELSSVWFENCDAMLHDTTINHDPVHTAQEDVEELVSRLPHVKAYGYHASGLIESKHIIAAKSGDVI